jgi:copper chaperone CopZ
MGEELAFAVPGMSCGHCESAVKAEVSKVPGVSDVVVNLATKSVVVHGSGFDHHAVFAAVEEAGYEAVTGAV